MHNSNDFREMRYTVSQAAEKIGVSIKTLQRLDKKGIIQPTRTLGNQRRYSEGQIMLLKKYFTKSSGLKRQDQASLVAVSIYKLAQDYGVHTGTIKRWEHEGKLYKLGTKNGVDYYLRPNDDINSRIISGNNAIHAVLEGKSDKLVNTENAAVNGLVYLKLATLALLLFILGIGLAYTYLVLR